MRLRTTYEPPLASQPVTGFTMAPLLDSLSDSEFSDAQQLMAIFETREEDGRYHFSDAEIRHFLPLVFLTITPPSEMPEAAHIIVVEAAAKAGLKPGASQEEVMEALLRYYDDSPVNSELLAKFNAFVREKISQGGDVEHLGKALTKVLATDKSNRPVEAAADRGNSLQSLFFSEKTPAAKKTTAKKAPKKGGKKANPK